MKCKHCGYDIEQPAPGRWWHRYPAGCEAQCYIFAEPVEEKSQTEKDLEVLRTKPQFTIPWCDAVSQLILKLYEEK